MGGGEGSTAREILRQNNVEKLVMCDIDEVIALYIHIINVQKYHAYSRLGSRPPSISRLSLIRLDST